MTKVDRLDRETSSEAKQFAFSGDDFRFLKDLAHARTGICLEGKNELVYSRLTRHLRRLGLTTFAAYCDLLRSGDEAELDAFTNSITTNLTYFFREDHHFEHLAGKVLPEIRQRNARERRLRIWSAGCSTGEEPYSIAMVLRESFAGIDEWDARILATDIDGNVLDRARRGIYDLESARGLDGTRLSRWTQRGKGGRDGQFRIKPQLREMISFARLNLMEDWPLKGPFDVIFCRNVLIYFEKPVQTRLVERYAEHLRPGGMLYIGHSESVPGINRFFEPLGQTRFLRRAGS